MSKASKERKQLQCSFCSKEEHQVHKLVAGPGVYICDECIKFTKDIADRGQNTTQKKALSCSFCQKTQGPDRNVVAGPGCNICDECIELCSEIAEKK